VLKTSDAGKAQSYLDPAKTLVQAQAWYAGDEVQMTPAGNGTIFTDWMLANARAPEPSADGSIAVTFLPTPLKEVRKPTAFDGMNNPTWSPAAVPANTFGALDGAPRLFVQTSIPFGQVLSAHRQF